MRGIIVVTGLDQLPPGERWPRLIAPLADELAARGLGELPDLPRLGAELDRFGTVGAAEVAVRLVNLDYGRELVDRLVSAAGIQRHGPVLPERWRAFFCDDYYASRYATEGRWDDLGQFWYVVPAERIYEREEVDLLVVGGAGYDGIDWGYRRGQPGFWAYPIDGEFVALGSSITDGVEGWLRGETRF